MDWKRIKTILILALIGINVLLAWTLYVDNKETVIDELDRMQVISLLEDKMVMVLPEMLNTNTDIDNISLNIQTYDADFVKSIFDNHDDYDEKDIYSTLIDTTQNMFIGQTHIDFCLAFKNHASWISDQDICIVKDGAKSNRVSRYRVL